MPRRPGAMFVVVPSEFGLVFLETAFNGPAGPTHSNQFLHRGIRGGDTKEWKPREVSPLVRAPPTDGADSA